MRGVIVNRSRSGRCEKCSKDYHDLYKHFLKCHDPREGKCPFCRATVQFAHLTGHLRTCHPDKCGVFTTVNYDVHSDLKRLNGSELKDYLGERGMEVNDAIPHKWHLTSHDSENRCYRWVSYVVDVGDEDVNFVEEEGDMAEEEEMEEGDDKETIMEEDQSLSYNFCLKTGGDQMSSAVFDFIKPYVHGHGAPLINFRGDPEAEKESCLFSNISPQNSNMNSGAMKRCENHERWLARHNRSVIVVTGPGYLQEGANLEQEVPGGYKLRVPDFFWKFIIIQNDGIPDRFQIFKIDNVRFGPHLYQDRLTISELRNFLPFSVMTTLPDVSYTWDSTSDRKSCSTCHRLVSSADYAAHVDRHKTHNACLYGGCFDWCATAAELENHMKQAHPLLPCPEEGCTYSTRKRSKPTEHANVHSRERVFPCPKCGKEFTCQVTLDKHVNQDHEDIKNWYCPITACKYANGSKGKLEDHILTHHSCEDRFFCPICEQRRTHKTRQALRKHLGSSAHNLDKIQMDEATKDQQTGPALNLVLIENNIQPHQFTYLCGQKRLAKIQENPEAVPTTPSSNSRYIEACRLSSRRKLPTAPATETNQVEDGGDQKRGRKS